MMNREVILQTRPNGTPTPSDFSIRSTQLPSLTTGQVIVKTLYLSVDPYMRELMSLEESFEPPFEIGEALKATVIGKVIESNHPDFTSGEVVRGHLEWKDYNVTDGFNVFKIPPEVKPHRLALGTLGSTGLTAYLGLTHVGKIKSGETVVVSGAGGAVGSVAAQVAKIQGCRVIGISGSDEKNRYLVEELGLDGTINYKTTLDIRYDLERLCPNGIDVYFDNTGDETLNAVASLINDYGRIISCGQISQYNGKKPYIDPNILGNLTLHSASILGFLVSHFTKEQVMEGRRQLAEWVTDGKMKPLETIIQGLENAPSAFIGLFSGLNAGKMLVEVAQD